MPVRRLARLLPVALAVPLALAACATGLASPVSPAQTPQPAPPGGIDPATSFTPLAASTLTTPAPVTGTDGRTHLTYELVLTNATPGSFRLDRVDVLDAANQHVVRSLSGAALAAESNLIGGSPGDEGTSDPTAPATTIPGSATALVWLDVVVDGKAPTALEHHVTGTLSAGGKPAAPLTAMVGTVAVSTAVAPVLGPPVQGGGSWYASDGCCTGNTHHRRGIAPINGTLLVPQRFAIDWFLLDEAHRAFTGDPAKLTSYLAYDKPAIAAHDGVVLDAVDGIPETTSVPEPPPMPPITQTVGNHATVMIAPGEYLLYGHFRPGTVAVRTGQQVKRGDVLGHIGSSGNSTTPHLHLQVMTGPTYFPTDSTPYTFDCFRVDGQVTQRIWDDVLGLQRTPILPFTPSTDTDRRHAQMPLDRNVVTFC